AHIRVPHAVKEPHAPPGQATGRELMPGDAPPFALAARTRSQHEIVAAGPDRLDQGGDAARNVGAAAVHEHPEFGVLGRHGRRQARPAIAAPGLDDVRTRGFGPRRGGVATAAVDHDDAGYDRARDATHHIRDRLLLIERRYHHDDATCRGFAHATMI